MPNQTTQGVGHHCFTPFLQRGAFFIEVWMIFKDLSHLFVSIYYRTPFYKGPAEVGASGLQKHTRPPIF